MIARIGERNLVAPALQSTHVKNLSIVSHTAASMSLCVGLFTFADSSSSLFKGSV
jgi:hypothetical protein